MAGKELLRSTGRVLQKLTEQRNIVTKEQDDPTHKGGGTELKYTGGNKRTRLKRGITKAETLDRKTGDKDKP